MHIDISRYLGPVERTVTLREHQRRPAQVVTIARSYDAPPDDVWDAITNPERIPRWFLPISGDLRLGGRFQLEGNAGGEITRCEPPSRLSVTWEFGGETSGVHVMLTESKDKRSTTLTLEHVAHSPDDFWRKYGPGATGVGWDLTLVGIGEHLAGAADIDPQQAAQWPTSSDGRRLVAHCSDAWGQASIQAGTPEPAALAAADRTTAFYTGEPEPSSS